MIVLGFPADEAQRIVEGVQTVVTYAADWLAGPGPWHQGGAVRLDTLVGQTVAVARLLDVTRWSMARSDCEYEPGAIVGSVTVAACVPIRDYRDELIAPSITKSEQGALHRQWTNDRYRPDDPSSHEVVWSDLADQLPFSDFTPGRQALIFTDPAPCEQRCPNRAWIDSDEPWCPVCWIDRDTPRYPNMKRGTCPPIPYTIVGPIGEWNP